MLEEVGVTLTGPLIYVESTFFISDSAEPVLNVVLMGRVDDEMELEPACPRWTRQSIAAAEAFRLSQ